MKLAKPLLRIRYLSAVCSLLPTCRNMATAYKTSKYKTNSKKHTTLYELLLCTNSIINTHTTANLPNRSICITETLPTKLNESALITQRSEMILEIFDPLYLCATHRNKFCIKRNEETVYIFSM